MSLIGGCTGSSPRSSGATASASQPSATPAASRRADGRLIVEPAFVSLAVGASQQLTLERTGRDGQPGATGQARWTSTQPSIASVDATGLVTALAPGEASIAASSADLTTSSAVIVQPSFVTHGSRSGSILALENRAGDDVIRIGVDDTLGGAIALFSLNGRDFVAKAGYGSHLIAVGLYDGDDRYDSCNGCEGITGWNPTESCDQYRHGSPILAEELSDDSLYIKSRAAEWRPDDKGGGPGQVVGSDVVVERWITPVANHPYVFQERYRLTHDGNDQHANASNAIPSYELTADLGDWVFYSGRQPGTGGPLMTFVQSTLPQWPAATSIQWLSEMWGGWADASGFGFAAYAPQGFPYATASQATMSRSDRVSVFGFLTPYAWFPGTTIEFTTFLMLGQMSQLQRETYDIARRLGPFADTAPPVGELNADTPRNGATVSGTIAVEGYSFDSGTPPVSLDLLVDGRQVTSGRPGILRPDLRRTFAGVPPNAAFHLGLDTTTLANGTHVIQVLATDAAGNVGLLPRRVVTVAN